MVLREPSELLLQARQDEGAGDHPAAVSKLRAYLGVRPQDGATRVRLGRLLMGLSERASARQILLPLDNVDSEGTERERDERDGWRVEANRLLAALDEQDGALTSARVRWERVLADDVDDAEAHAHLRSLGAAHAPEHEQYRPTSLSVGTLAAPEGVRLSRFRLIREVGRGASAAVYLVHDERLNLPLALKVLHPQLAAAARTEARERFFAEARLAMRLRHPGVVAIYDVDEGARCLAMEFVPGGTIRDRVRPANNRASEVTREEAVATARSLFAALTHVHDAGIVHGDLKPGNVLLRRPADVVLADFGVAALVGDAPHHSDQAGGTPLYLAPEQFQGAPTSVQTDLFAAGAILWELVNGYPLRRQSDLLAGNYAAPISSVDSSPMGSLVAALLAADPARRPPSARAALASLD